MKRILLRPAAAWDVEEAFRWYEEQRCGQGDEFLTAVGKCLRSIEENPDRYPVVHRETRRALLSRFPYGLFFRSTDRDILVIACMHASRAPRRWQSR